jgi:predicted  nucleic acid-binding Zn ribbon protein
MKITVTKTAEEAREEFEEACKFCPSCKAEQKIFQINFTNTNHYRCEECWTEWEVRS